ncbi:hypothetical protein [Roseibium sp.]|uniref:hypothetical protein n=1 Tax=Roseibium sp. TaxID=1936156 RepID=UPI003B51A09C
MPGLHSHITNNTRLARLLIENPYGQDHYICYLCGDASPLFGNGVACDREHIIDWKRIKEKLIEDGNTKTQEELERDYDWIEDSEFEFSDLFIVSDVDGAGEPTSFHPSVVLGALYCSDLDNLIWAHGYGCNQQKADRILGETLEQKNLSSSSDIWRVRIRQANIETVSDLQNFFDIRDHQRMLEAHRECAKDVAEAHNKRNARLLSRQWQWDGTTRFEDASAAGPATATAATATATATAATAPGKVKGKQTAAEVAAENREGAQAYHLTTLRTRSMSPPPVAAPAPVASRRRKFGNSDLGGNEDEPNAKRQKLRPNQTSGRLGRWPGPHAAPDHTSDASSDT